MNTQENAPQMNMGFGITTETRSDSFVPILTAKKVTDNQRFPNGWEFPVAKLVNVTFDPAKETKNGNRVIMSFIFKDSEGRQYTHIEWEQDPSDEKYKNKMDGLNSRVKHIYVQTVGDFPQAGIGVGATSFADYFKRIVEDFNAKVNAEGKKVYYTNPCYIKLTYYKKNLGFPLSPNFLEKFSKEKACTTLTIKPSEKTEAPSGGGQAGGGIPGIGGGAAAPNASDLPDFGSGGFN